MRKIFTIILLAAALLTASAQKKVALVVGISDYHTVDRHSEWNDIHGENDLHIIVPQLKRQGFEVDQLAGKAATAVNIRRHLDRLARRAPRGAIVYLHFSMHGQPFEDLNGDEDDGWDESLVPVDAPVRYHKGVYEGDRHITDDELAGYTGRLRRRLGPHGKLYVAVDACHAGTASRDLDDDECVRGTNIGFSPHGRIYRPKTDKRTLFCYAAGAGQAPATFLEACKSTQRNAEARRGGVMYGLMSYYISRVMASAVIGTDDGWVYRVRQLMRNDIDARRQDMVIETSR